MTSRRRHHVEVRGMTCANCSRTVGDDGNDAPVLAAGAMALSSVSVLANSLAFRLYTREEDDERLGRLPRWGLP